jgi:hypothetical protein
MSSTRSGDGISRLHYAEVQRMCPGNNSIEYRRFAMAENGRVCSGEIH